MKRSYILAPNFDCPPEGPIAIGRIITDPFSPETCLNAGGPIPIPSSIRIHQTFKADWESSRLSDDHRLHGIWGQFLSVFGVGGDAGVGLNRLENTAIHAKRLETRFIEHTDGLDEWINKIMREPAVEKAIKRAKCEKNLYLVVGVKIVSGASMTKADSKQIDVSVRLGAELSSIGAPGVQIGPEIAIFKKRDAKDSFEGSSDFVFAYRLKEIYYRKREGVWILKDVNKGAAYSLDQPRNATENETSDFAEDDFELQGLAKGDVGESDLEIDPVEIIDEDDGSLCDCYWNPSGRT
jgi:hypothetical protein